MLYHLLQGFACSVPSIAIPVTRTILVFHAAIILSLLMESVLAVQPDVVHAQVSVFVPNAVLAIMLFLPLFARAVPLDAKPVHFQAPSAVQVVPQATT